MIRQPVALASLLLAVPALAQTCYEGAFGFPGFAGRPDVRLFGSAEVIGNELQLTPAAPDQVGAAWFAPFKPKFTDAWFMEFTFRLDGQSDGFALVLQNLDAWQGGTCGGSCLGYDGMEQSLAVEFDTFAFGPEIPDDHVSVQSNFAGPNSSGDGSSLVAAVLPFDLNDNQPHRARLVYDETNLTVWVDGQQLFSHPIDFTQGIASPEGCAVVGFTGATGGLYCRQIISDWAFGELGINVDTFSTVSDALPVGDAFFTGGALRLTQNVSGQAGAAWNLQKQIVVEPWVTTFEFRLDGQADGFAFVVQDQSFNALGGGGSGLGYAGNGPPGIARSLAVEFDTFSFSGLEAPADHVSIQTRFADQNSWDDADSLGLGVLPFDINDNQVHRAVIAYDGVVLRVAVDGVPIAQAEVDFADMSDGQAAWVGFTGATGAASASQDILNWRSGHSLGCLNTELLTFIFDQSANPGDLVEFHFDGSGSMPRTYQWYLNGDQVVDDGNILGSDTDTLVILSVGPEHAGLWNYGLFNDCSGVGSGFFFTVNPTCDPDLNQDGNVDQDDVLYLINVVGGGDNPSGIDPDFNQDGNVDQDDVAALINAIGGGGCP
ncbi:MAG: hypothetical protein IT433_05270 [Phycisphaerales bacterium]|nr:hypothetical protein [Phycisphaerales bacterium]